MGFEFPEILNTYKKFRENKIKLFDRRFFNPFFVFKRATLELKFTKKEQRYYKK